MLNISLSTAYNFGINWVAVKRALGTNFILNGNYSTPVSITPLVSTTPFGGGAPGLPQIGGINNGNSTGVTAIINALSQQGRVSVVTEPRVVCLNNQVSVIKIANQTGYLASVQNTTVAGVAGGGSSWNCDIANHAWNTYNGCYHIRLAKNYGREGFNAGEC